MHEPLKGRIEDYLQGAKPVHEVEQHLQSCATCNDEVQTMVDHSKLLRSLKTSEEMEPAAGFYARVLNRIEESKMSIWTLFSESVFATRLSYASLTLLVLLGTYLVTTTEREQPLASSTPEVMLAGDEQARPVGNDPQKDREAVLVNLATYQE
jgi:predicted anti-sigma-YlaC factor YlaD